jgi:hypothetical protein
MSTDKTTVLCETPADEQALRDGMTAQQVVHLRAKTPGRFGHLLTQDDIDALLHNDAIPQDGFYLGAKGHAIARSLYRDANGNLRPEVVSSFLRGGANLVIDNIGAHLPPIAKLAQSVATSFEARVVVNAYLSYGSVSVFTPHYDLHDVLAMQISGAKLWRGYGRLAQPPTVEFGKLPEAPEIGPRQWQNRMDPGDLLYVPRGEIHDAVAEEFPSIHLTFGIHRGLTTAPA